MSLDSSAVNPSVANVAAGDLASTGLPSRAQYVVVGGGVIGTSIAYHLATLGATDVVLLERKQLTSGTTWHAAGEVVSGGSFSENVLDMVRHSVDLYNRLEAETGLSTGFKKCGYLQLATTKRRDESYRRETSFQTAFGLEKHVLSRAEVADLVPMLRTDDIVSGFFTPNEGRANPVDVTMSMAKGARQKGARIFEDTEVLGFTTSNGTVTGVQTSKGDIECQKVVIAAGLWGRELAAKAGVTVPLQAAEHYYLLTEPIEGITSDLPVIEEPESYGYYREEGGGLLVGMFEPVGAPWSLDGTPKDSAFAVLPPDWDRLSPFLEVAMRRVPALEDAGIRTLFCGPESFTDDLSPMLGEAPELRNFFLACGLNSVGILLGGGLGHVVAQWLIDGEAPIDITEVSVDRTHEFQATRQFRAERTVERLGFLLNDGAWPNAQVRAARNIRRGPFHQQHVADGAHFVASSGWEYPEFFAGAGVEPVVEWGFERGMAFERTGVEHKNVRENVGAMDLTVMSNFLVQGPHAEAVLNRVCANDVAVPVGRIVYTQWLNEFGGIIADVTVTRLAEDEYLVIGGDNIHRRIPAWVKRQTRDDEFVTVTDTTSGMAMLSVQGPKSRELLQRLSPDDWSNEAFPFLTAQKVELGYTPLWALRVTYVGELGWDLVIPTEFGTTLYEQIREAGSDLGFLPTGLGALSSMRLEKAYRDMGHDIDSTDNPLEAGLGFAVAWDKPGGFVGRDALAAKRDSGPLESRMLTFLLQDPDVDLVGAEPIFWDGTCVGYVRAGAYGYTLGGATGLGMVERKGGITADMVAAGGFEIEVAGRRVAAAGSLRPFFDPDRTRPNS
jgi:glycine cleavage system aminomethyltransferase T/glycine/D-amino acid oxidase-like deaminating enzyme